jgi:imidazole glycerol-phosphate synthase subunit HisF
MLMPRIIPCLLIENGGFVKTTRFKNPDYVGDPVNVINLFNRFEVDEIIILDISATRQRRAPDFDLITDLASECWVPLSYGGGLNKIADIQKVFSLGVEKVILNTAACSNPRLIREAADIFGSQAIVGSMDIKPDFLGRKNVYICSGTHKISASPVEYAKALEQSGVGEIFLNSIHRDGTWNGYDLDLIEQIAHSVSVPVIACGGAGHRDDLKQPLLKGASAVAAGSIFIYKGREKGVLINFPPRAIVDEILKATII